MEIEDITIQQYFTMQDSSAYDMYVDILNPVNSFAGRKCNVNNLTFDEVQVVKMVFQNPTVQDIMDLIILCYRLKGDMKQSSELQYLSTSVFDLFRTKKYLQDFIVETVNKEQTWLSSTEKNEKLLMINAEVRLKPFSHLLTKIRLAEQFSTKESEIGLWKYSKVFTILTANKVRDDLTREYNEIK